MKREHLVWNMSSLMIKEIKAVIMKQFDLQNQKQTIQSESDITSADR